MLPSITRRAIVRAASGGPQVAAPKAVTYKAKRTWPPDFEKMSPKHQFRLERKYKRRAQLKWARPRLMAATRIAQWAAGGFVLVYGIFFMDWNDDEAFKGPREWYNETVKGFWTHREPVSTQARQQPQQQSPS